MDVNRLLITESAIKSDNYFQLSNSEGGDRQSLLNTCQMFCIGYLYGSQCKRKLTNDPHEFIITRNC